ncbi:unnamed protein product [Paramecium sonneborni]|uniref:Uncharacterized protein n=1 Tax=Paramecium sonneborni TaxID=65129 RepID=A0A8S1N619_9CILI|nr:unnamed protein product [Paramecium sonneborni]
MQEPIKFTLFVPQAKEIQLLKQIFSCLDKELRHFKFFNENCKELYQRRNLRFFIQKKSLNMNFKFQPLKFAFLILLLKDHVELYFHSFSLHVLSQMESVIQIIRTRRINLYIFNVFRIHARLNRFHL